jgi:hypothetical protein
MVVDRTGTLSWRHLCVLYGVLLAISYGYVALPGDPDWLTAEVLWIAVDVGLLRAMLRRSINALIVFGALDVSALSALIVAESAQPQAGFSVMACLLVARVIVLVQAWRQRIT